MLLNDGSQYRIVTDPAAHMAAREVFAFRAASARGGTDLYVDTAFRQHRIELAAMPALVMYQFVYATLQTPEAQARFFLDALGGPLSVNEMVMVDPEVGGGFTTKNAADWVQRWLATVEPVLQALAWVYVPGALATALAPVVGDRIVMAPRYSGTPERTFTPTWPHEVHQFTDRGDFPGCTQPGDLSYTALTAEDMLRRCNPQGITCECAEGPTRDIHP